MTPRESLHRDYGLLTRFLRRISRRYRLRVTLEIFLLLSSGSVLVLLGSPFALDLGGTFPYLPFIYSLAALLSLFFLFLLGLWRIFSRLSIGQTARGLEEKFPRLRDDVTNSLLLFNEIQKGSGSGRISEGLVKAQLRKTAEEVQEIKSWQMVSLKGALRHLKLLVPLLITFSLVLALDPQFPGRSLALILDPLSHLPVRETFISVEPRGGIVLRGTQIAIKAKASGNVPDEMTLTIWPENRGPVRLPMELEGNGGFFYKISSAQYTFQYQAQGGRGASLVYGIRVVDPPEIEKVRLTLIPPDYTGLPEEVKEEGHIEALKGTVVNLMAQATRGVKEGKLILNQESELSLQVKGSRLAGNLLIFYPGAYSIKVKDDLGFDNPNPVHYEIRLVPDKFPEAEILNPAQDMEISGDEVIPIVYAVRDDFGISGVRLSYQMGGVERSINLKSTKESRSSGPETFKWDLGSLSLTSGDRVVYRIEVSDNDTISGPKAGYSKAFVLSIRDEKTRAAKEGEEAQKIADALLDLLADQLEETKKREDLAKSMDEILKRLDRNLGQTKEKVERFDLEALRRNLSTLRERIHEESQEIVTREMERLALLAEDVAKKAKMNEVEALAREIRNRQRRLIDSIQDLKERFTREGLEAVMRELKKVEELLRSVMEALSKLTTGLPEEFINSQELRGLDFHAMFKDLEEMQKMLSSGDISGALEMAQRLLQSLSEMMAALGRAGMQANMSPFGRLQGEMSRQTSELERILAEEKSILNETEMIDKEMKGRIEAETGKRLSRSHSRMKEILERLNQSLPHEQADLAEEMEMLLKRENLEGFSHLARDLERHVSESEPVKELVKELREMAESLIPHSREMMTSDLKKKFPDLSSRQENLRRRTESLKEQLEMVAQLFPGLDTEILNDLKEAGGSMKEASNRLGIEDAPGAIPPEQEVIRRLTRSQQMMQQMAQQMAMRMQAARWGYPLAYDPRPGWYYGPWVPMPTLPQPESKRLRERGFTGIDREEFEPPSKDAYKAPGIFREKAMEALKEGIPSQYRREVERYFRGLTR